MSTRTRICHYCAATVPEREAYYILLVPPSSGVHNGESDSLYYCLDDYEMVRANLMSLRLQAPLLPPIVTPIAIDRTGG